MTSIDLKDAYYSVKISEEDSKYLKCSAEKVFLKFVVLQMSNELPSGPPKFTKLTKPTIARLRTGVIVAIHINDIVIGETYEEFLTGTIKIIKLFLKLDFIIHPEKAPYLLTTFTKNNLLRLCFQFKGNVDYTYH